MSRRLILQQARGQRSHFLLPLLGSLRFHVLFHSPMGVLFTFPSRYYFAIGHPGVFSLSHLSESIVEESSEELAMIYLIHTQYHEKWIQIFDCYLVSAMIHESGS